MRSGRLFTPGVWALLGRSGTGCSSVTRVAVVAKFGIGHDGAFVICSLVGPVAILLPAAPFELCTELALLSSSDLFETAPEEGLRGFGLGSWEAKPLSWGFGLAPGEETTKIPGLGVPSLATKGLGSRTADFEPVPLELEEAEPFDDFLSQSGSSSILAEQRAFQRFTDLKR